MVDHRVLRPRLRWAATVAAAVAALSGQVVGTPDSATAGPNEWAINGVFDAVSNGELAQTNEKFKPESPLRRVWTVTSSCTLPTRCVGSVTSSDGWTATLDQHVAGEWSITRTIPRWIQCADGTFADGEQLFRFWASDRNGTPDSMSTDFYVGEDLARGPSGACGVNKPVVIRMPFTLTRS